MSRESSRRIYFALILLGFSYPGVLKAQDQDICSARDGQRSIDACSRIISVGRLTGKDLATIYVLRASIYRAGQDYDHAIEDLTHAIELLATTASAEIIASAYATRASIYLLSGKPDKALADYHQVLAYDPKNSLALSAIGQIETSSASSSLGPAIEPPAEPLPDDIKIEPAMLQLVQTDPFFSNCPAIRIGTYGIASSFRSILNPGGTTSSNSSDQIAVVHWLRAGISREDSTIENTNSNTAGTMDSETENASLEAANGFFSLGFHSVTRNRFGTTSTTSKLIRVENLHGKIFSMHPGDHISYDLISQISTQSPGFHFSDQITMKYVCAYGQTYDAQRFYPALDGTAHLLDCTYATIYKGNSASNSTNQSRILFFDDLGYWLSVDPSSPQEALVQNGLTVTMGKYVTTIVGTSALKSLSLAR